jgi:hypothetical protein
VACEVHKAKELADTSRHSSLKQQMLLLEHFHSSIIKGKSKDENRSNGASESKSESKGESGGKNESRQDTAAELSTVDTVDKENSAEEEAGSLQDPSPLVQQASVLICSKIKVGACN